MDFPPSSPRFEPVRGLTLPELKYVQSPNFSARLHGIVPYLVVLHRPVSGGNYLAALRTLTNPHAQVSAHILTEGKQATQLVEWHWKAWACATYNSVSYNIEADDNAWDGSDWDAFLNAAHITAWICHKTNIPPVWSRNPHQPGVTRHYDLGAAGGGHTDPTLNLTVWRNFIKQVAHDVENTGWRSRWGRGRLLRLGT